MFPADRSEPERPGPGRRVHPHNPIPRSPSAKGWAETGTRGRGDQAAPGGAVRGLSPVGPAPAPSPTHAPSTSADGLALSIGPKLESCAPVPFLPPNRPPAHRPNHRLCGDHRPHRSHTPPRPRPGAHTGSSLAGHRAAPLLPPGLCSGKPARQRPRPHAPAPFSALWSLSSCCLSPVSAGSAGSSCHHCAPSTQDRQHLAQRPRPQLRGERGRAWLQPVPQQRAPEGAVGPGSPPARLPASSRCRGPTLPAARIMGTLPK